MRFVLCPGYVTSKTDGDRHFIGVNQLARLYRLGIDQPDVVTNIETSFKAEPDDINLYPLRNGGYFDARKAHKAESIPFNFEKVKEHD